VPPVLTLAEELLPTLHELRGIAGELGFHPYRVTVVTMTGGNLAKGIKPVETQRLELTEGDGYAPRVRFLNKNDFLRGAPAKATVEVGPVTPAFDGGGLSFSDIEPSYLGPGTQVFYLIEGPGFAEGGTRFVKVSVDTTSALGWKIQLERVDDGKQL